MVRGADLAHRAGHPDDWPRGLSSGYQPISAISLGERMADTILDANEELVHGFTYSGHPVASAVALKNLEVIETAGLVPRVKTSIGPYLQRRLAETFADHPIVGEVRGQGLLAAIELVRDVKERRFFPDLGKYRSAVPQLLLRGRPHLPRDPRTRWCWRRRW